ncbi:MAG: alpha/beta hydrolase, partial [Acidocella sp.]|nr:alpha/beta hydrolase [Acidocella sp.]
MTISLAARSRQPSPALASHVYSGATSRQPVTFQGLFGWLHTNPSVPAADVAILLCPAVTRDGLDSHFAMRVLADDLAATGTPVLRFNYPGTGDSADIADTTFDHEVTFTAWLQSVAAAADWLRATTGAKRLILGGLRFGATIAALAAEPRGDVAGLLLLAPVLRGKSYMRQLWIEAGSLRGAAGKSQQTLDLNELHFDKGSIRLIEQIDLRKLNPV